jgi:hypothetical protein
MPAPETLCHCGRPLHYSNPTIQQFVEALIAQKGEYQPVTVSGRTWLVQRHYIALHGLKGGELPSLGFKEVLGPQTEGLGAPPLAIGALVEKVNSKPDDAHRDGARARITMAVGQMPEDSKEMPGVWGYFVEWEDIPGIPVFIAGNRIRLIGGQNANQ